MEPHALPTHKLDASITRLNVADPRPLCGSFDSLIIINVENGPEYLLSYCINNIFHCFDRKPKWENCRGGEAGRAAFNKQRNAHDRADIGRPE